MFNNEGGSRTTRVHHASNIVDINSYTGANKFHRERYHRVPLTKSPKPSSNPRFTPWARVRRSWKLGRWLSVPIKEAVKWIWDHGAQFDGPRIAIVTAQVHTVTIGSVYRFGATESRPTVNGSVTILGLFLPRCQHEVRENRSVMPRIDFDEKRNGILVVLSRSRINGAERA